jgi:3-phosphoshikimate 1-carboxyvinyltransferase
VAFHSPESSQLISALLLAAPYATGDVLIEAAGPVPSVPYLKLTTAVMERFGVAVIEQYGQHDTRFIVEAPQRYTGLTLPIEPDASNATYFLSAPAVAGGRVTVEGLGTDSIQGDARFVDVLERMGCRVEREPSRLTVSAPTGEQRLRGVDVDLNDMPDTVQTLAVVALFAEGPTAIRRVANLRIKETDRLAALRSELTKLGGRVEERADGLTVHPPVEPAANRPRPAVIDTYNDHRMAMSFTLAGLKSGGVVINDPQCCAKTFPDFFERWERMVDSGRE